MLRAVALPGEGASGCGLEVAQGGALGAMVVRQVFPDLEAAEGVLTGVHQAGIVAVMRCGWSGLLLGRLILPPLRRSLDKAVIDCVEALLRLTLLEDEDPRRAELAAGIAQVSATGWDEVLDELDAHRVTALVAHTLRRFALDGAVPPGALSRLHSAYRHSLLTSEVHSRALRELLAAFRADGIDPILFKGLVLSTGFYPDPGTRPMVDIDLLIDAREVRRAVGILRSLGYCRRIDDGERNPNGFRSALGIAIDLHWRFELFPPEARQPLTETMLLPALGSQPVRTWEPNAMIVHLAVHLTGHRQDVGMRLGWLLDFAFVIRRTGHRLRVERLAELCPDVESRSLLWRVLAFVQNDCGLALPHQLAAAVAGKARMSLPKVLREFRLRPWGLPGLKGWLNIIASRLGRKAGRQRRYPYPSDLLLGVLDALMERRDARRATACARATR